METIVNWATDTLLWTGLLMALVLLIRRPVAQVFGARAAYALWLLPLARFVLPPVVLPAWMRPAETAAPVAAGPVVFDMPVAAVPVTTPEPAAFALLTDLLVDAGIAVWLVGAVLFLGWRIACYRAMTRHLMDGARPVGQFGSIQLVETPAVSAPVAFGVRRRVIALPAAFMASEDITARDLAIAHEIAHHRGHDLVANLAAQPLLALHWFNPVAWAGWRAMRRDQEAACDARVMAGRAGEDRARYGEVIAACSRQQNLALAAPMAGFREIGPVFGEKAIVHRLRSLGMNTTTRRHRTGLLLIGAAALVALPITAKVSYAEDDSTVGTTDVPASSAAEAPKVVKKYVFTREDENGEMTWESSEEQSEFDEAAFEADMARMEAEIERAEADAERAGAEAEHRAHRITRRYVHAPEAPVPPVPPVPGVAPVPPAPPVPPVPEIEHTTSKDGKVQVIRMTRTDDKTGKRMERKMVIDSTCEVGKGKSRIEGNTNHICTGVPHDMIINTLTHVREGLASSNLSAAEKAEALADIDAEIAKARAERSKG
ncbi:M56 family metallopeptidase [Croceicoccus naphthovorans]|nr:M56 family metallopeptidase [Croceicoccus naphthovorans]MBB3988645.1 beta-lactamase regulating signal transducer with metallopeptidase domain [Croceicoccus naphthovorans]